MCSIARKPICVTRRRKNISPGGLIWRAVAVIEDSWEYQDLHSSDRLVSFTGGLCIAFTDLCAAFTNPLHSSTCVASSHLDGSVHLLFEAFISFFPSKASAQLTRSRTSPSPCWPRWCYRRWTCYSGSFLLTVVFLTAPSAPFVSATNRLFLKYFSLIL